MGERFRAVIRSTYPSMAVDYTIKDEDDKCSPVSRLKFPERKSAENFAKWLNINVNPVKKRFELIVNVTKDGHPFYLLYDHMKNEPVKYIPHVGIGGCTSQGVEFMQEYINFLNEIYECGSDEL